jgi:hypothetical protein
VTLTAGRRPLGADPAGWFSATLPKDVAYIKPHPRRIQAIVDGRSVIDTENVLLVHRVGHPLSNAFPADEVGELPNEGVPEALQGQCQTIASHGSSVDRSTEVGETLSIEGVVHPLASSFTVNQSSISEDLHVV